MRQMRLLGAGRFYRAIHGTVSRVLLSRLCGHMLQAHVQAPGYGVQNQPSLTPVWVPSVNSSEIEFLIQESVELFKF